MKTVAIFENSKYTGDWPPEKASDFLKWFEEKIKSIPAAYVGSARVILDSNIEYESSVTSLVIEYERPYTREEEAEIDADRKRRIEQDIRFHEARLARLKSGEI